MWTRNPVVMWGGQVYPVWTVPRLPRQLQGASDKPHGGNPMGFALSGDNQTGSQSRIVTEHHCWL